jgi:hypothetical protein
MKLLPILVLITSINNSYSASYDTLPKGVNTFVFKQVITNQIESKYDANKSDKTLVVSENFTSTKLSGISDAINSFFQELKSLSPEAFNTFSLGEFEARAWANVNAQGMGFGHGITNNFTIYGSLPIYHMKTSVNFSQKTPSNLNQIKNTLIATNPTTAVGTFIKQLTLQLPDSNESLLQSVLTNYYHYKPLGTWEKDALGDIELGAIYRITDSPNYGISFSSGLVLPTGTPDDPDSLQDISTGDGQLDYFLESNCGINFNDHRIRLDFTSRFTYQIPSMKSIRLYDDPNTPLGTETATVQEKLGNKIDLTGAITYSPNLWTNISTAYIVNKTNQTEYNISNPKTKYALESGTDTLAQWGKISFGVNTIELYKKKQFELPVEIILSAQKLINGQNTANYNRYDLDMKFYF